VNVPVEDPDVRSEDDVLPGDLGRPPHVEPQGDGLIGLGGDDEILEVQDDVAHVLLHPCEVRELVEGVVEPDLGHRCTGNGGEQGAPERVAERVAEPGIERADREPLPVALFFVDRLDGGALDDEHVELL
jgi:hypothetical protein